jgi:hypothetical protein
MASAILMLMLINKRSMLSVLVQQEERHDP